MWKEKCALNSKSYGYFSGLESLFSNTNDFSVSTAALCWEVESKWDEAGQGDVNFAHWKTFMAISTVASELSFEKLQLLFANQRLSSFKQIVCYEKYNRILSTVPWKDSVLVIRFNIIILINSAESHMISILTKIMCSFFCFRNVSKYRRRSQWLCGRRCRYAAVRLLSLEVRIPLMALMSVSFECCLFPSRGLCVGLITRPEKSYRMWCVSVWSWSLENGESLANQSHVKKTYTFIRSKLSDVTVY
jgi:hypothetical protein